MFVYIILVVFENELPDSFDIVLDTTELKFKRILNGACLKIQCYC